MTNQPDVILLCNLGNGKGLGVTFRGEDVDKAVETASDPLEFPYKSLPEMTEFYYGLGYNTCRIPDAMFPTNVYIRRGFPLSVSIKIANAYLAMVTKAASQ